MSEHPQNPLQIIKSLRAELNKAREEVNKVNGFRENLAEKHRRKCDECNEAIAQLTLAQEELAASEAKRNELVEAVQLLLYKEKQGYVSFCGIPKTKNVLEKALSTQSTKEAK